MICTSFFAVVFAAMALWEIGAPRRALVAGRNLRWPNNLGILLIGVICVRVLIPTAAVGAALFAAGRGWGLFHLAGLRLSVAALLGFLVLDLVIYAQHVVFHKVPLLWRLHRMHHADLDIDVTTGGRFHPFEILISMLIKIATVIAFGIPVVAVVLFEVVLNATCCSITPTSRCRPRSTASSDPGGDAGHAPGAPLDPAPRDRQQFWLQSAVVGPLVRHLPCQPEVGHDRITIGLPIFRDPSELRLDRLLTQPFRDDGAWAGDQARAPGGISQSAHGNGEDR